MKQHRPLLAALVLSGLILTGCSTAAGSVSVTPEAKPGSEAASPEAGHLGSQDHGSGHGHSGGATPGAGAGATPGAGPSAAKAGGPSDAARMVCGEQSMDRLTSILALASKPHTISNWADSTFTCTYHLQEGSLEISVKETASPEAARTHFDAMQALAKDAKTIGGLASLGFPAYETAGGSAVFQKDSFVLDVDATGLPPTLGPHNVTRNALAYQVSTTILACWVEHP